MALPDDCEDGDYVLHRENAEFWMAEAPCYKDPQMSPVGFGRTQQEAVGELISQPQFQEYLKRSVGRRHSLISRSMTGRPKNILPMISGTRRRSRGSFRPT